MGITVTTLLSAAAVTATAGCGGSSRVAATSRHESVSAARSSVTAAPAALVDLQESFTSVIHQTAPEVVQISTPQGLGSGVVFNRNGDVVTNAHVVAGNGPLRITDSAGHAYAATLVGSFTPDDLAVVHAAGATLSPASFADSRSLQVGDIVLAIGNPLGLRTSVTDGIVSALGRTVDEPDGAVLPSVIQTSAPINPGNSGGALVDLADQVVGIPTLAATDPELGGSAPGIGFAIPSSLVTDIATQLIKHGKVTNSHRAFLGVVVAASNVGGAVLVSVQPGGPAAKAGIKPGDVIVAIQGRPVSSPADLTDVLATLAPGQTVTVSLLKPSHARATVKVRLGRYPS